MVNNVKENIIRAIRYLHESKKMSYEEIGLKAGYSKVRIIQYRQGKFFPKKVKFQNKMLEALERVREGLKAPPTSQ